MGKALYLFVAFLLFSCKNETDDLRGHWHIFKLNEGVTGEAGDYSTLDFDSDSLVTIGKYSRYGGIQVWHDRTEKSLKFLGECYSYDFKYRFINKKQLLLQDQEAGDFVAKKVEPRDCDKQNEYFYGMPIDVDLPIVSESIVYDSLPEMAVQLELTFGTVKKEFQQLCGNGNRFVINESFAKIEDIELYYETVKASLPHKGKSIKQVIFADKNTSMRLIKPLFDLYKDKEEYHFYFALRKKDTSTKMTVCIKEFNAKNHNWAGEEDLILDDWLRKT